MCAERRVRVNSGLPREALLAAHVTSIDLGSTGRSAARRKEKEHDWSGKRGREFDGKGEREHEKAQKVTGDRQAGKRTLHHIVWLLVTDVECCRPAY